jgi:hypothetical protein
MGTFKQYLAASEGTQEVNEIFGLFKNNAKIEKIRKEREKLKNQSAAKKAELDKALKDFAAGRKPTPAGAIALNDLEDALSADDRKFLAKRDRMAAESLKEDVAKNPNLPDNFTIKFGKNTVFVSISPFSWMHDGSESGYSLSLLENSPNIAREFFELDVHYHDLTKADITARAKEWLKNGGVEKLQAAVEAYSKWKNDVAASEKKRAVSDAANDAAAKKTGMKYKVMAVVEPQGSDYVIEWYSETKPTAAAIKKVLIAHKSLSYDNYKISKL